MTTRFDENPLNQEIALFSISSPDSLQAKMVKISKLNLKAQNYDNKPLLKP
jgi:hypothetical protein